MEKERMVIMSTRQGARKMDPCWIESILKDAGFDLSREVTHSTDLDTGNHVYIQYYEETE